MFSCFKPKPKSIINFDKSKSESEVLEIQVLDDPDVAERDPSGRYIRYEEILGRGECKIVYKAFDEVDGIEVAWNQVRIDDHTLVDSPEDLVRLYSEVSLLKSLKHENIIKCDCAWVDLDLNHSMTVNMITELFTSGDLRQYRRKHKNVDVKAIKNWARQVLRGLHYLHTHDPPIIHRDLQVGNIFINGNTGRVKIGDLGLALVMPPRHHPPTSDCSFIPMAPELYNQHHYNHLVDNDIYSFGICMLEMATCCEYHPYTEFQLVSGPKPASLAKLTHPEVKRFIEKCLVPASIRSSAADLLNDPFLSLSNSLCLPTALSHSHPMETSNSATLCETCLRVSKSNKAFTFTLFGKEEHCNNSLSMNLRITGQSKADSFSNNIDFIFDLQNDNSLSIAREMVDDLHLPNEDVIVISGLMDELMTKLSANHCIHSCESGSTLINTDNPQLPLPMHMKDHNDAHESFSSACSIVEFCKGSSSGTSDNFSGLSSISPLTFDGIYDQCNELKMELFNIDVEYEHRKAELMKMRVDAIENAKRKWASGKSSIT